MHFGNTVNSVTQMLYHQHKQLQLLGYRIHHEHRYTATHIFKFNFICRLLHILNYTYWGLEILE